MASLENGINGEDMGENVSNKGTSGEFTDMIAEFRREKFRAKSAFTRIKNKVLFLIDQPEKPGYREIQEACGKMDTAMGCAMDVMTRLSEFYGKNKEKQMENKVMVEMETLDGEFSSTYAAAQQYIHAQKENSSVASEMLSIDLLNLMNISDQSKTYREDGYASKEVRTVESYGNIGKSVSLESSEKQTYSPTEYQKNASAYSREPQQAHIKKAKSLPDEQFPEIYRPVVSASSMNATAAPFEPTGTCNSTPPPLDKIYGGS